MEKKKTKYRIKKVERIDGNGKTEVEFLVQKKIVFFWKLCSERCYGEKWNIELPTEPGTYFFATIGRYDSIFDSEHEAIECIKRLKHPNILHFMHKRIIKLDGVYFNLSRYRITDFEVYYENADSLEEIEEQIKSRKIKKYTTILNYKNDDK